MGTTLCWKSEKTSPEISTALRVLAGEYPIRENSAEGRVLSFKKGAGLDVSITGDSVVVTYDRQASALRGVGFALAGEEVHGEKNTFDTFGVMLDVSRNAVMTVAYAKSVLRRLALAGYNMAMLYTEDTYRIAGEPHFGYLRGAYSLEEVRELDDYAASLGIELIGCIQTLGHLGLFLRSSGAGTIRDTADVLLVGEEKTYALIRKMLDFWKQACRSRRIHIGMDETHSLGRGRYMDMHGWRRNFDIFTEHLNRVNALCGEAGLSPMIWSDMYFRMGSATGNYYDPEADIPSEIKEAIPSGLQFVYWDYYHLNSEFYGKMIDAHRQFGSTPPVAAGIWTWFRFFYDHKQTSDRVIPCIEACRENGVKEFFFTMWGDDGAYCNFDTVFAGLLFCADRIYGASGSDEERLDKFSRAIGCIPYKQAMIASEMNYQAPHRDNGAGTLSVLLWDDPLLAIGWRILNLDDIKTRTDFLQTIEGSLSRLSDDIPYAVALGQLLAAKLKLRAALQDAYRNRNSALLKEIRLVQIPEIMRLIKRFASEYRRQWTAHYKYEGMEANQIRLGGLQARYLELAERLSELEEGRIDSISELETDADSRCNPDGETYRVIATPGSL